MIARIVGASGEAAEAEGGDGGTAGPDRVVKAVSFSAARCLGKRHEREPVAGGGQNREQHAHLHLFLAGRGPDGVVTEPDVMRARPWRVRRLRTEGLANGVKSRFTDL